MREPRDEAQQALAFHHSDQFEDHWEHIKSQPWAMPQKRRPPPPTRWQRIASAFRSLFRKHT